LDSFSEPNYPFFPPVTYFIKSFILNIWHALIYRRGVTQNWLDCSAANHNVMLINDAGEGTAGYDLRFRSSEASIDQPYLEILWTLPVKSV